MHVLVLVLIISVVGTVVIMHLTHDLSMFALVRKADCFRRQTFQYSFRHLEACVSASLHLLSSTDM